MLKVSFPKSTFPSQNIKRNPSLEITGNDSGENRDNRDSNLKTAVIKMPYAPSLRAEAHKPQGSDQ